jgi:hypothetical protein
MRRWRGGRARERGPLAVRPARSARGRGAAGAAAACATSGEAPALVRAGRTIRRPTGLRARRAASSTSATDANMRREHGTRRRQQHAALRRHRDQAPHLHRVEREEHEQGEQHDRQHQRHGEADGTQQRAAPSPPRSKPASDRPRMMVPRFPKRSPTAPKRHCSDPDVGRHRPQRDVDQRHDDEQQGDRKQRLHVASDVLVGEHGTGCGGKHVCALRRSGEHAKGRAGVADDPRSGRRMPRRLRSEDASCSRWQLPDHGRARQLATPRFTAGSCILPRRSSGGQGSPAVRTPSPCVACTLHDVAPPPQSEFRRQPPAAAGGRSPKWRRRAARTGSQPPRHRAPSRTAPAGRGGAPTRAPPRRGAAPAPAARPA